MKRKFWRKKLMAMTVLMSLLLSATGCSEDPDAQTSSTKSSGSGDSWVIYWYLCGSDLESNAAAATTDLQEMLQVTLPENVKVVIQTGGAKIWQNDQVKADRLQRYEYSGNTLELKDENVIYPEDAHLLVAKGAAIESANYKPMSIQKLRAKVDLLKSYKDEGKDSLRPLFTIEEEYKEFRKRHGQDKVKRKDLKDHKGNCYMGIDAGSTTSKLVLINEDGEILYSAYKNNEGKPLESVINMVKRVYEKLPSEVNITYSGVTRIWRKINSNCIKCRYR